MNYGEGGLSASDVALLQGRNNDGFGDGNGAWWIILFLIFGWGRGGYGYGGGSEGGVMNNYVLTSDFSQLSRQISDTYNMTERKLDGINNGLCSGFYQEAQLINGINTNILTTGNGISREIADVGYGIKDCCCQQLRAIDGINFNMAQNTCAITNNATMNTRDIIENQNNGTRAILEALTNDKLERKNEQIAMLQTQLNKAELKASQEGQTREIINTVRPCPIPAYQSCNPWGCNCNQGCGCAA